MSRPGGTVSGALLTGGASTRMGRDKALIEADGWPLAVIAAEALRAAGADPVVAVGGDMAALQAEGLTAIADDHPGEGPLGGLLAALDHLDTQVVVVLACDLPAVTPSAVTTLLDGMGDADVAVAVDGGGHRQWLVAAWRRERCVDVLGEAFAAGLRAVHRAAGPLAVRNVVLADPSSVADVDAPGDLARALRRSGQKGPSRARPT